MYPSPKPNSSDKRLHFSPLEHKFKLWLDFKKKKKNPVHINNHYYSKDWVFLISFHQLQGSVQGHQLRRRRRRRLALGTHQAAKTNPESKEKPSIYCLVRRRQGGARKRRAKVEAAFKNTSPAAMAAMAAGGGWTTATTAAGEAMGDGGGIYWALFPSFMWA